MVSPSFCATSVLYLLGWEWGVHMFFWYPYDIEVCSPSFPAYVYKSLSIPLISPLTGSFQGNERNPTANRKKKTEQQKHQVSSRHRGIHGRDFTPLSFYWLGSQGGWFRSLHGSRVFTSLVSWRTQKFLRLEVRARVGETMTRLEDIEFCTARPLPKKNHIDSNFIQADASPP